MNHVVILGAGLGARLKPLTNDRPKCAVQIAGEPLAKRMLRQFAERGCKHGTVVVGHFADRAKELIGTQIGDMAVDFIENTEYATTNTMYSTLLAIDCLLEGGFLVEGDIVADNAVVDRMIAADLNRSHWGVDKWTNQTGSRLWTNNAKRIVKQEIWREPTKGDVTNAWKSGGMLKIRSATARKLAGFLREESDRNIYYDNVIGKHIDQFDIDVLDFEGAPWVEIDDLHDMAQARQLFEDAK